MAQDRTHVEEAHAGDIIGLHNHETIRVRNLILKSSFHGNRIDSMAFGGGFVVFFPASDSFRGSGCCFPFGEFRKGEAFCAHGELFRQPTRVGPVSENSSRYMQSVSEPEPVKLRQDERRATARTADQGKRARQILMQQCFQVPHETFETRWVPFQRKHDGASRHPGPAPFLRAPDVDEDQAFIMLSFPDAPCCCVSIDGSALRSGKRDERA